MRRRCQRKGRGFLRCSRGHRKTAGGMCAAKESKQIQIRRSVKHKHMRGGTEKGMAEARNKKSERKKGGGETHK